MAGLQTISKNFAADLFQTAALTDIARDLHTTDTIVNMTVAFYMLAMSIFPLWW